MTIDVLGLGPSIEKYFNHDWHITFGVNDIYKHYPVDYLVCIDRPENFTLDRLKVINESYPKKFYTHLDSWQRPDLEMIELIKNYDCKLNLKQIPHSIESPYVAAALAFNIFHPTEIVLYGCDYTDHWKLKDRITEIRQRWHILRTQMAINGCQLKLGVNAGELRSIIPLID